MSFRITDPSQLEHVSPHVRAQLERHLSIVPSSSAVPGRPASPQGERKERNAQPEQEAGAMLVEWMDSMILPNGLRPGLFFAHVQNAGVAGGKVRGGIMKGQGVRKGHPDYILDLPLGRYHGFRLELKALDGSKPDQEQLDYLERLEAVGYKVAVAWGFDDAKRACEAYLALAR